MRSPLAFPRAAVAGAALLAAACGDRTSTEPSPFDRATGALRALAAPAPAAAPSFAFLAPLGPARAYWGAFDAGRSPMVEICRVPTPESAECEGGYLARYTLAEGTGAMAGGVQLVVDPVQQAYRLDWPATGLAARTAVRVRVLLDGAEVGRAHARVPAAGETAEQLASAGYAAIEASGRLPVRFRLEASPTDGVYEVPGAPTAPAAAAIPRRAFAARGADFAVPHPTLGAAGVSHNTVLVAVTPTATVAQLNALVARVGGLVVGGSPGGAAGGVLALRVPGTTHAEGAAALAALRAAADVVAAAAPDTRLKGQVITYVPTTAPQGSQWQLEAVGAQWNHTLIRAPQLWNLTGAARKRLPFHPANVTAVFDAGFSEHEDLALAGLPWSGGAEHGTQVAGVIGATFNNDRGTDGVNPVARLLPVTATTGVNSSGELLMTEFDTLLRGADAGRVRVVNVSLGYGWADAGVDPMARPEARDLVDAQGAITKVSLRGTAALHGGRLPVIVTAAGNDSRPGKPVWARYGSPLNAAAHQGVKAVIVVEALAQSGGALARAAFSDTGGHVSAPGQDVRVLDGYAGATLSRGTSFAAPHVAAVAGFLYALLPQLAWPSVDANPVLDVLRETARPAGDAARHVDAFAAALALDGRHGVPPNLVRTLLVDVDDGTADGNQRTNADGSAYLDEDADLDGGPGDGAVDMSDFRRWRDWLLAVEGPAGLALDGPARHPKKDVNQNQRWNEDGDGDNENIFPRGDFDGSGRLTRDDLPLLAARFQDPDYDAGQLAGLVHSGDLRVNAQHCRAIPGVETVRSRLVPVGQTAAHAERTHLASRPLAIYTVPAGGGWSVAYRAEVEALDAAGRVLASGRKQLAVALGGDVTWEAPCARLTLAPDTVRVEPQQTVRLQAAVAGAGLADTTITWVLDPGAGSVNALGFYTAPSQPGTYPIVARHESSGAQAKAVVVVRAVTTNAEVRVLAQEYGVYANGAMLAGGSNGWADAPAAVQDRKLAQPSTLAGFEGSASATASARGVDRAANGYVFGEFSMGSATSASLGVVLTPAGGHAMAVRGISLAGAAAIEGHASISAGDTLQQTYTMGHGAGHFATVEIEVVGAPVTLSLVPSCGAGAGRAGGVYVQSLASPYAMMGAAGCAGSTPPSTLPPGRYKLVANLRLESSTTVSRANAQFAAPAGDHYSVAVTFTP